VDYKPCGPIRPVHSHQSDTILYCETVIMADALREVPASFHRSLLVLTAFMCGRMARLS